MKPKVILTLLFLSITGSLIWFYNYKKQDQIDLPQPTDTIIKDNDEETEGQLKREAWLELMHQADPQTDWKMLEYQTQMTRHENREAIRNSPTTLVQGEPEEIIPGFLEGVWKERGSINQAGSVYQTYYDQETDKILVLSAGGTLFQGNRDGLGWEVINQDVRLTPGILEAIPMPFGKRLIALIGRFPHFSDNGGVNWNPSNGVPISDNWGNCNWITITDAPERNIYLLSKLSYWADIKLYKSTDLGQNFTAIHTFSTNNFDHLAINKPHGSNDVYLIHKTGGTTSNFYRINSQTDELEPINPNGQLAFGDKRANIYGIQLNDTTTRFYAYTVGNDVYQTEDFGESWNFQGTIPDGPWEVGMFVSPSNPDFLLTGGIECYKSLDGGVNWTKQNGWGAYYGDVVGSLHADMMVFAEFETTWGQPFTLISNHGGLSISYDNMETVTNIGMEGLNVSQYYDVRTDPVNPDFIYAGTQDQGFQRGSMNNPDEIMHFDQVISGDYGHIAFSNNGNRLWTVYPGGWITYYANPQTSGYNAAYDLESEHESVWIPPLMESPNTNLNEVYLAGGNVNGGSGSHIIKLTYQFSNIIPEQLPFDFKANSGGEVSAMKYSPIIPERWYAGTTNGRFFRSDDSGQTWEQTVNFLPGGHYLYGQSILPSKINDEVVYYAGSGYSNPAVYKSENGGHDFYQMAEGLPPTLVFEMAANEDESLIFAATEAGPFVYVQQKHQWYDMSGMSAPTQTYWSVEYLEADSIIRFGTFGRGIWDFKITEVLVTSNQKFPIETSLEISPNPGNGLFNIQMTKAIDSNIPLKVFNNIGQLVYQTILPTQKDIAFNDLLDLTHLSKGLYFFHFGKEQPIIKQIIIN